MRRGVDGVGGRETVLWKHEVLVVGACNITILNEDENVIREDKKGAMGVRLLVAEEAVVIAVGRHKRFEFRRDGREKVAAK